jgi:hypothetical protein
MFLLFLRLCKLQKGCTRLAAASDKVYQLLAHGRWFSPSTPASSTTKTGRHDIAEILLKAAINNNHDTTIICSIRELNQCVQQPRHNYHLFYQGVKPVCSTTTTQLSSVLSGS